MSKFLGIGAGGIIAGVVVGVVALALLRPQICNSNVSIIQRLCGASQRISSIGSGGKPLTGNVGTPAQKNAAALHQARRQAKPAAGSTQSVMGNTVSRMAGAYDSAAWAR